MLLICHAKEKNYDRPWVKTGFQWDPIESSKWTQNLSSAKHLTIISIESGFTQLRITCYIWWSLYMPHFYGLLISCGDIILASYVCSAYVGCILTKFRNYCLSLIFTLRHYIDTLKVLPVMWRWTWLQKRIGLRYALVGESWQTHRSPASHPIAIRIVWFVSTIPDKIR